MDFGGGGKRGRPDDFVNGNGGLKKSKQELESIQTGIGSKLKPCTKFFSTSGCSFGEGCHFSHYVPGGYKAASQILGTNPALPPVGRNLSMPPSFPDASAPSGPKTKLCNRFRTREGCKFGDKCAFAHGEWELGKPSGPSYDDRRGMGPPAGRMYGGRMESPSQGPASGFGQSATAKISIEASLAGAIIGKNGVNSKHICRVTGVKLSIRDHESDPNQKNIELHGTFDQIKQASDMVHDLTMKAGPPSGPPMRHPPPGGSAAANNFRKTRICENFERGSCTFGDRCHFAHGAEDLRRPGV